VVYRYGLCYLVIPLYNLYRLYVSYIACKKGEPLPWDEENAYELRDKKPARIAAFFAACLTVSFLVLCVLLQAEMPRHRGDMTAAAFTKNFNDLLDYSDLDYGEHLNTDGSWVEDPPTIRITWLF
jgi:hypothetical protein